MGQGIARAALGVCCILQSSGASAQTAQPYAPPPAQPYAQPYAQPAQPTQVYVQPQPQQLAAAGPCPEAERRPARLPYRPGPGPQGYVLEDSSTVGLWVTGAALLGGAYIISVLAARPSSGDGTEALYVPILGPWIALSQCVGCNDTGHSALVLDGLTQVAGAVFIVLGLAIRNREYVRTYDEFSFMVTPRRFGNDSYGVGIVGRF